MALDLNSVKALIFDLDDTLFDTYGQLVKPATLEAAHEMIALGLQATPLQCLDFKDELMQQSSREDYYQSLVKKFGVVPGAQKEKVTAAGFEAFHNREIKEIISVFEGVPEILESLQKRFRLFLVTLGTPKTQQTKVTLLKIEKFFEKIFYVDVNQTKSKKEAFEDVLQITNLKPSQVVSIGNRLDGEIADGKSLGMQTIYFPHGEYAHFKPVNAFETPDQTIQSIDELREIFR